MPLTFPAHQGLIAPIKIRWPQKLDATALCIAAAAPDFAYPLGAWLNHQSHTVIGLLAWAIPFTILSTKIVRWRAANGIFAYMPDLGPLRLRSYRVLSNRKPNFLTTVTSTILGASSHVLIDGFSHSGRWGANLLNLNDEIGTIPFRGTLTIARSIQYFGHLFGSLSFILLLLYIAKTRRLEKWYGQKEVQNARKITTNRKHQTLFWLITLAPPLISMFIASRTNNSIIFLPITTLVISILLAGTLLSPLNNKNIN